MQKRTSQCFDLQVNSAPSYEPMCSPSPSETYKFSVHPPTICKTNPCTSPPNCKIPFTAAPPCNPGPVCSPLPLFLDPRSPSPGINPCPVSFEMLSQCRPNDNNCGARPVFLIPIRDLETLPKGKLKNKVLDDELANTMIPQPLAYWDQKNWPLITHPENCPPDNYNSYKKWKINQEVRDGKRHPRDIAPYFGQKVDVEENDDPVILRLPDIVCYCQLGPGCTVHEGKCAEVVPRFLIYIKNKKVGDEIFADWRPETKPDANTFSRFVDFDFISQW